MGQKLTFFTESMLKSKKGISAQLQNDKISTQRRTLVRLASAFLNLFFLMSLSSCLEPGTFGDLFDQNSAQPLQLEVSGTNLIDQNQADYFSQSSKTEVQTVLNTKATSVSSASATDESLDLGETYPGTSTDFRLKFKNPSDSSIFDFLDTTYELISESGSFQLLNSAQFPEGMTGCGQNLPSKVDCELLIRYLPGDADASDSATLKISFKTGFSDQRREFRLALLARARAPAACEASVVRTISSRGLAMNPSTYALLKGTSNYVTALKQPAGATSPSVYRKSQLVRVDSKGNQGFVYETGSCSDLSLCTGQMQKVNHHFLYSHSAVDALQFESTKFIGFNMKVAEAAPLKPTILFQLWQGSPHSPPLSAQLITEANGNLSLVFSVGNNQTGSNPSAPRVVAGKITPFDLNKNYSIVLRIRPEHSGSAGSSLDNNLEVSYRNAPEEFFQTALEYKGLLGYNPADPAPCVYARSCAVAKPNPKIDFKFGIYREAEASKMRVLFHNIKLANSFEGADPHLVCEK